MIGMYRTISRKWPPQYIWAVKGSGGGSGSDRIVVDPKTPILIDVATPKAVWTYENNTNYPMFVQTFDSDGDEMRTDVTG